MNAVWPRRPMAEAAPLVRRPVHVDVGATYREIGIRSFARGIFHKAPTTGLDIGEKRVFAIKPGDLLFNIVFAWEGAVAVASLAEEGTIGSHRFLTCVSDPRIADPCFLYWWFSRGEGREQLLGASPGGAGRNRTLGVDKLATIQVPLPSIEEQRRIVGRIQALSERLSEAKQLRKDAVAAASSYTWAVCEKCLTAAASSYQLEVLDELVDKSRGISYGIVQTGREFDGGVPTIRAGDLQWFKVRVTGIKRVDPQVEKSFQRTRLRGNELLLRIRGGVGELAVCPTALVGGNVSREIAVIPLNVTVDPTFAMFMLAAPSNQALMHGHVRGTSYVGINLKDVRRIAIPVPPISEQKRIVSNIKAHQGAIDSVLRLQAASQMHIDALLPSALDKAFKGEL
jgi:type I restriction enzyme S subunit